MDRREEALATGFPEEMVEEQPETDYVGIVPQVYKDSFAYHLEQTLKIVEAHAASCAAGQKLIYDYNKVVQDTLKRFIEAGAE